MKDIAMARVPAGTVIQIPDEDGVLHEAEVILPPLPVHEHGEFRLYLRLI